MVLLLLYLLQVSTKSRQAFLILPHTGEEHMCYRKAHQRNPLPRAKSSAKAKTLNGLTSNDLKTLAKICSASQAPTVIAPATQVPAGAKPHTQCKRASTTHTQAHAESHPGLLCTSQSSSKGFKAQLSPLHLSFTDDSKAGLGSSFVHSTVKHVRKRNKTTLLIVATAYSKFWYRYPLL